MVIIWTLECKAVMCGQTVFIRACSFVSPGSTLPPTNSHNRPRALWAGRRQIRNLSPSQMSAATTSVTVFSMMPSPQRIRV